MMFDNCNNTGSFIRQDPISKEWVIFSPSRGKRPHDVIARSSQNRQVHHKDYDERCPFCPGNEQMLSSIICEIRADTGHEWICRAVSNKYPVLSTDAHSQRFRDGMFLCMGGYGHHEVVIDNPHHSRDIPQYTQNEYRNVMEIYHKRYCELMEDSQIVMITIFRNHGLRAGTSLSHPHSQIVGSPTVPRHIRVQEQLDEIYFDDYGTCIYCDLIKNELFSEKRIVDQNRSFVAFVPYAAKVPYEIWILPRRHTAVFGDINGDEKNDLSLILQDVLCKMYNRLDDPHYNYVIHSFTRFKANEPHLHWFVQILPRRLTPAGFELGSGFRVNPSIPEEDAELLRG